MVSPWDWAVFHGGRAPACQLALPPDPSHVLFVTQQEMPGVWVAAARIWSSCFCPVALNIEANGLSLTVCFWGHRHHARAEGQSAVLLCAGPTPHQPLPGTLGESRSLCPGPLPSGASRRPSQSATVALTPRCRWAPLCMEGATPCSPLVRREPCRGDRLGTGGRPRLPRSSMWA